MRSLPRLSRLSGVFCWSSTPIRVIQAKAMYSNPNSPEIRSAAVMCVASKFSPRDFNAENADSMPHLGR